MIVLANDRVTEVTALDEPGGELWIRADELQRATGFELKPQGACLGELCVPMPDDGDRMRRLRDGAEWLNVSELSSRLDQKTVVDPAGSVWSLGPIPDVRRSTLESGIAPDFEIADRNGEMLRLSDLRGKKVLIVTWASW